MQSFKNYMIDSLGEHYNSAQLYKLFIGEIDIDSFAINTNTSEESAKEIKDIFERNLIVIYDQVTLENKYGEDIDNLLKSGDKLVELGTRYGADLGLSPEEKKIRDRAKQNLVVGEEDGKKEKPVDDTKFVEMVCNDILSVKPGAIAEFFWRKAEDYYYLFIVTEITPEVKKILKKI